MQLTSRNKNLELSTPQVMGILNVTPDSFSDGGKFNRIDYALNHVESMLQAGTSIIDIGGESTRPGAKEVALSEELDRVVPIIEAIRQRFDCWISIDTSKAQVMKEAVNAGADLINDVRALQEPNALEVAAKANVPICLMHMQGQPRTMQHQPNYNHLIQDVSDFLSERISACENVGISRQQLILDPGFGFGKTLEHNYQMLAKFEQFHQFGLPVLAGMSRKSMIFNLLGKPPAECLAGSLACATIAAMKGAHIIRVHDARETAEVMKIYNMVLQQSK
ncbi:MULTISPECIES: dihydropteroate synthase [unclassified Photobacterium]|uniref:dihydropteroate synthase n=1 Tax=unclassified Photobacterium TaxID=2628852 RepID=UPI000D168B06|nr:MULTISPECIES: dihydropteroate synthase [unclassified Photobacterium]PSV25977.1 dihydropteroate synthase [Photobacterium sp. GB-56]PSV31021.1 dihydropteroate synthase [Photobacterium sp. GB-72]PSV36889.1 dihydropteroate synthase [Photobacterium sp. GB-27]PSV37027.1 dihydropteroate synthase [Photobacterium sp. GB-210]PSV43961.1 dihydropteroate synthase [Photobacterium sp. GB-36]